MTEPGVLPRRTVPARSLRHGSSVVDLHERLTIVTGLDQGAVEELVRGLLSGAAQLEGVELAQGDLPVVHRLPASPAVAVASASDGAVDAEVAKAHAALTDAETALTKAKSEYAEAQEALVAIRRDADRDATGALEKAEANLDEARQRASEAARALSSAREEATPAPKGADADLEHLRARRDRMQATRDEIAERLLRLPPVVDVGKLEQALAGLRRLRQVKPRPMARAVEIADRLAEVDQELANLGLTSPPEWLARPALDALRSARAELEALETGKPTVAVDPAQVQAVEAAHARVLDAEAKVNEKGSRTNRRRLDEATAAERESLHSLGLSSYDQFLKYLAPTLDASARQERVVDARARVEDAATVWAELHGGSVPDRWTALHLERIALFDEAAEIVGESLEPHEIDERLRNHLEAVVDTSWAEDALANALAETKLPVSPGGLEAAAEQIIAEAPSATAEREQAEGELREIDAELASIESQLAELTPQEVLGGSGDDADDAGGADSGGALAGLEEATAAAEAAVADAEAAVVAARERATAAEAGQAAEAKAAERAETAKATVEATTQALTSAEQAMQAATAAAAEATQAAASAGAAAAAATGGASMEARLSLVGRAVAHRDAGIPIVIVGAASALGHPAQATELLSDLAGSVQVVVIDADGSFTAGAERLGDGAKLASL